MNPEIKSLQSEAIEKCFNSKNTEHMDIMKEMIAVAFNKGRKQGQREMAMESKQRLSNLIPHELDY